MAAVAQKAAKDISDSTKRVLAAKKTREFSLSTPANFTDHSRGVGRKAMQRNAQEHVANKQARRLAGLPRQQNVTLAASAEELNAHGYRTRRGGLFHKTSVLRLLAAGSPPVPAAPAL